MGDTGGAGSGPGGDSGTGPGRLILALLFFASVAFVVAGGIVLAAVTA